MASNRKPIKIMPSYIPDVNIDNVRNIKGLEAGFGSKGVTNGQRKTEKPKLIKQQRNRCYYCKCLMVDSYEGLERPANLATIEHLYTRRDIRRSIKCRIVVACNSCNSGRDIVEQHVLAKEVWCDIFDIRNLLIKPTMTQQEMKNIEAHLQAQREAIIKSINAHPSEHLTCVCIAKVVNEAYSLPLNGKDNIPPM